MNEYIEIVTEGDDEDLFEAMWKNVREGYADVTWEGDEPRFTITQKGSDHINEVGSQ